MFQATVGQPKVPEVCTLIDFIIKHVYVTSVPYDSANFLHAKHIKTDWQLTIFWYSNSATWA